MRGFVRGAGGVLTTLALCVLMAVMGPFVCAYADETQASEPQVSEAQCYFVSDGAGHTILERNADQQMEPASITKIMTAMVVLDSGINLDGLATITEGHYQDDAQLAELKPGDSVTVRQLFQLMLVYSANDAADNLAINAFGSIDACVERMNQKAQELGMTGTHFSNVHGLSQEGNYSCARDLVTMGRYAFEHYQLIAQTVHMRSVDVTLGGEQKTFRSTDDLMETYVGLRGIKTGAVESGKAFLGTSTRGAASVYSCVLGCSTNEGRFTDTETLMNWAYDHYFSWRRMSEAQRPVRWVTSAVNFYGKLAITGSYDVYGRFSPDAPISYVVHMPPEGTLQDPGGIYGVTIWTQDGFAPCAQVFRASKQLYQVSMFEPLVMPLFYPTPLEAA